MPSLAWSADPHLDHADADARAAFLAQIETAAGEILLLTGDISVARSLRRDLEALADAAHRPVYFVCGNHDHFGSSVAAVRDTVLDLATRRPDIQWLPPAGVVSLGEGIALVGSDGWADGRHGNPLETALRLNDDRLIAELAAQPTRRGKLAVKRALADADAARLAVLLERAAAAAQRIVVATHVPPFVAALPTQGHLAGPEWLPLLVCGATGTVLRGFAASHPAHELLVLCGHTHVATEVQVAPNLRCRVGAARYGQPGVIDVPLV